jgi:hypothetical protein
MGAVIGLILERFSAATSLLNSVRRPDCRTMNVDPFEAAMGIAGEADLGDLVMDDTEPSCRSNALLSTAIGMVYCAGLSD